MMMKMMMKTVKRSPLKNSWQTNKESHHKIVLPRIYNPLKRSRTLELHKVVNNKREVNNQVVDKSHNNNKTNLNNNNNKSLSNSNRTNSKTKAASIREERIRIRTRVVTEEGFE